MGILQRLLDDAKHLLLGRIPDAERQQEHTAIEDGITRAVEAGVPEEAVFTALHSPGAASRNLLALRADGRCAGHWLAQHVAEGGSVYNRAVAFEQCRDCLSLAPAGADPRELADPPDDGEGACPGRRIAAALTGAASAEPAPAPAAEPGGFDSARWHGERDERIAVSRAAGWKHLDEVPCYVETLRGREIFCVHDTRERGRIRTVANTGDVVVHWLDAYSGQKNLATARMEGRRQVLESWLAPTDLRDYVLADTDPVGRQQAAPAPAAEPSPQPGLQPLERLAEPPHLNYRVQRTALNGATLLPPVCRSFSDEELQALRQWLAAAGFSVTSNGRSVHAVGDGAPRIPSGMREQRLARQAVQQQARDAEKAQAEAARASEYASLPASAWIERAMGSDFANAFNRLALARYLDGKAEAFAGLMSGQWREPLARLGFDLSREQIEVAEAAAFLKARYQAGGDPPPRLEVENRDAGRTSGAAPTLDSACEILMGL